MIDEYRKGWALRYLREAKAELDAARKMPYMAPSLILESIRKARNAIYYSLGEPAFIETLIKETAEKQQTQPINDPILKLLVQIEETIQHLGQLEELDGDKAMKQANNLIQLASDIIETLIDDKKEE